MSKQVAALLVLLVLGGSVGIVLVISAMSGNGAGAVADNGAYERMQRNFASLEKQFEKTQSELAQLKRNYSTLNDSIANMLATAHTHSGDGLAEGGEAAVPMENMAGLVDSIIEQKLADRGPGGGARGGKAKEFDPEKEQEKARKEAEKATKKYGFDEVQAEQYAMIMMDERQRKNEIEQQQRDGSLSREEAKELMNQIKEDTKMQLEGMMTAEQLEAMQKKGGPGGKEGGPGGKEGGPGGREGDGPGNEGQG